MKWVLHLELIVRMWAVILLLLLAHNA